MESLQVVWFFLIALLLAVYAALDGFDLGAGFWSLFSKGEEERGRIIAAVGPFWDGNEVWLLTGGGALFAAFPEAYATLFSGFYLAFVAAVAALVLRAASVEFYGKHDSRPWRRLWGLLFGLSSASVPLIFGVALGNVLQGVPLDPGMNYTGSFADLFGPYALLAGLLVLSMFAAHGAAFLSMRLKGEAAECARRRAAEMGVACAMLFVLYAGAIGLLRPELFLNFMEHKPLFIVPASVVLAASAVAVFSSLRRMRLALVCQGLCVVLAFASAAAALYPNIVPTWDPQMPGLTIANASSSALTQKAMLVIAAIGMPLVVAYHFWIYRSFGVKGGEAQ